MTPDTLAKSDTEHAHQRAFFAWLNFASHLGFIDAANVCKGNGGPPRPRSPVYPELVLFHAIPNGGYRRKSEAGKLKAEGVKAGVLDTFLPVRKPVPGSVGPVTGASLHYNGLYIEFKEPKRKAHKEGGLSAAQIEFMGAVRAQGYCARVAYTWREAANIVMLYYGVDTRLQT